jgi:hypothetical protein
MGLLSRQVHGYLYGNPQAIHYYAAHYNHHLIPVISSLHSPHLFSACYFFPQYTESQWAWNKAIYMLRTSVGTLSNCYVLL